MVGGGGGRGLAGGGGGGGLRGGGIDRRAAILLGASREDLPPRRPLVSNDRMFVRLRRLPTDFRSPPRFFRTLAEISPETLPASGKEGRSTLFASSST